MFGVQDLIGWDNKNFREAFKTKDLPFITTEEFDWNGAAKKLENRLIWGDNLSVMRSLPDESTDLIYLDPPFFSGRNYNCISGDNDEIRTFNDIWDGGLPTYLKWLNARLWEMKRLLKPTGSIFVHLDWHACHYVKCELDKIFGYDNFTNELIWQRDIPGKGGKKTSKQFPRNHDSILVYSRSKQSKFYQVYSELNEKQKKSYRLIEENTERRFKSVSLGNYSEKSIKNMEREGLIYVSKSGKKYKKYYLDEAKSTIGSIWIDILGFGTRTASKERLGYPTQKPELLLERVIESCSDKGDIIADFFSGGGTTAAVAEKLGRRWIGCDVSRIAVSVARDRIQKIYSDEKAGIEPVNKRPTYGFRVESHGES